MEVVHTVWSEPVNQSALLREGSNGDSERLVKAKSITESYLFDSGAHLMWTPGKLMYQNPSLDESWKYRIDSPISLLLNKRDGSVVGLCMLKLPMINVGPHGAS